MIVAIDGPSGVGKSTVARLLARRLGVPVLDTGATYRAVALEVLEAGIDLDDREAVLAAVGRADIELQPTADGGLEVMLDGRPVGDRIRTPEVSAATSRVSVHPEIRARLVALQRRVAARFGAVVEGRDIGSVVFPETLHKFFLDARPAVRADRRHLELVASGKDSSYQQVLRDIEERDARDRGRPDSPLICDETYHVIDSSDLTPERIVDRMVATIRRTSGARTPP
ncbi:MAG: (d)CMP kinase [bacterium]|nr:(d)CMP kinase [bacterium]